MRRLSVAMAFCLVGSIALRCSSVETATPPQISTIQTDQQVYAVTLDSALNALVLTIPLSYTNPTNKTVYFAKCGHQPPAPVLQKYENEEWTNALGKVCRLILTPPVEVEPGETYVQTVSLASSLRPNTEPRFSVKEIPGTYRLIYRIYETWEPYGEGPGLGKLLPIEARVSNEFEVTKD